MRYQLCDKNQCFGLRYKWRKVNYALLGTTIASHYDTTIVAMIRFIGPIKLIYIKYV